jgi:hypothetical protein
MAVKPAILVGQQQLEVDRRDLVDRDRVAPDPALVGEGAERLAVAGQHQTPSGSGVERRGKGVIEQRQGEQRQQGQGDQHPPAADPSPVAPFEHGCAGALRRPQGRGLATVIRLGVLVPMPCRAGRYMSSAKGGGTR